MEGVSDTTEEDRFDGFFRMAELLGEEPPPTVRRGRAVGGGVPNLRVFLFVPVSPGVWFWRAVKNRDYHFFKI